MSNPNAGIAGLRKSFGEESLKSASTLTDLLDLDDGEGTPEHRAWIKRQQAKRKRRTRI